MNLFINTHILLWWLGDQPELSDKARELIAEGHNPVFVRAVVIWEIMIKKSVGKLKVPPNFRSVLQAQAFEFLDITREHSFAAGELPDHCDPFNRMLLAQAGMECLTLATHNTRLQEYKTPVIMA